MIQPAALFFGLFPGDCRWIQTNPDAERVVVQVWCRRLAPPGGLHAEPVDVAFERVFRHGYGLPAIYLQEHATPADRDAAIASRGFF
jgi:hypothetical protein